MNCIYCFKLCKNLNSKRQHEIRCKDNPNKLEITQKWKDAQKTKRSGNHFTKAKELGITIEVSKETRKKLSDKASERVLTEDTKLKISESMKIAHKEQRAHNIGKSRWNNEPSYPEKFFMDVINNEFIDKNVITEYPIGIYAADFCWPDKKKVIEIDGEQHYRFQEYIDRDKRKDKFLNSKGYVILRIRWTDMFHNPKDKIKECFEFIHDYCPDS